MSKKIYVGHSTQFDYETELYAPLKKLTRYAFIFPHEELLQPHNTRNIIANADIFLAEVSYPSTGLGIELGWANDANIPIICIYKKEYTFSSAIKLIANDMIEYNNMEDISEKLSKYLASIV